jgi:N-acetylglucosaminyl-diphospho-decaprenol L-rhamnosyltransferase
MATHPIETTASVVIVTYRSADVLPGCLASIAAGAEVIVVNQDGTDESRSVTSRIRPDARVIESGRNRGFGAGCNLGAANATGGTLIFLNPDARFVGDCLARLVVTSRENGGTLVGPSIMDDTGREVTRARNWSSAWTDVVDLLIPLTLQPRRWRRTVPKDSQVYRTGGQVPYVQGACMAIGRQQFAELGGFDEQFFLYGEEEDLALKLARRGKTARLDAAASIAHSKHTSVTKTGTFAVEQYYRTRALIYRRDGSSRDRGLALGAFRSIPLGIALVFLKVTPTARANLGYRVVEDKAWCDAALRGLFHGLLRHPVAGTDPAGY